MNLSYPAFPSLQETLTTLPEETPSIIFYFSRYLSVDMLITFLVGFAFLISLGRLAFLL
jgi:hypothetical protein